MKKKKNKKKNQKKSKKLVKKKIRYKTKIKRKLKKNRIILKKKKIKKKRNIQNIKRKKYDLNVKNNKNYSRNQSNLILKFIRYQEKIKNRFSINLRFNFLSIDKFIQSFFQKIDNKFQEYRKIKAEENIRIKIEKIEKEKAKQEQEEKKRIEEEEEKLKIKLKQIKVEEKLEKERAKDIKLFLRKEQALLRKEQAERQKRFLQELKVEQQIEKFRIREVKELEQLEKISLKEQRDDYAGLQERIEKLKQKYRLIRDQKIRERVEALGIETLESDDRETLLRKEKEYSLERQKIELSLESFYRSAASLVFQLNKRHITRHMSIFRCIDRRFETGEIFIKWDESNDEEWLILIYIKDNSPDKGIIIEDKTNPDKNLSYEFKSTEIFKASDTMVDSLTQLLSRERAKKHT